MRILVTGGAGFIGSNFVWYMLDEHSDDVIVNFDALTYAGNLESLQQVQSLPRYDFVHGDIANPEDVERVFASGFDAVVHFAAESHVDRSILDPGAFVRTNVLGTQVLLDAARRHGVQRFIHVSTDEVYGALGATGQFTEETPLQPNSPYSASKASSDLLARAYHHTYGLPVCITRCSNNYGPYQFPEKLIPLTIQRAISDEPIPVYGDGQQVRDWLHVLDHCRAIDAVLRNGTPGEVYNVGSDNEWANLSIVERILDEIGKPRDMIQFVSDRPGHDRRYAIDASKIRTELGWKPTISFDLGLSQTVQWYMDNQVWWNRILSGEYREFFEQQYGGRLSK